MHNASNALQTHFVPFVLMVMEVILVMYAQLVILVMDVLAVLQITTSLLQTASPVQLWEFIVLNVPHLRSALHVQLDIPEQLAPDALQATVETTAPHAQLVSIHQGNYAFHAAI
jgi:hypothetical protein